MKKWIVRLGWSVVLCSMFVPSVFSQTQQDSTLKKIEEIMLKLRQNYQHEGLRLRFDTGLQIPISHTIRVSPLKITPGFGFSLGIGYGFTQNWSAYIGFSSLSHGNDEYRTVNSKRMGFDGFHSEVKYKFEPYARHQFFFETGGGIYELVDQKAEGFTGWGISLTTGFDQFLTNEVIMSLGLEYRLTRFNAQVIGNSKYPLIPAMASDMLAIKISFIYTFPKNQSIFEF